MIDPLKAAVLAAMRRIARPLARLMIESGVGVGEFQSIMKTAFVRAAQDVGENQRPNASRISTLTGLTRREVAALLNATDDAGAEVKRGGQRLQRVLSGWWTDPDFQDSLGAPAPLPLRGRKVSFATLVKRYSGEPRVLTILDELLRVKAVRKLPDGRYEALSRSFAPARWDPEGITLVGEQLYDHLETLIHNLKHPSRPRYRRVIENAQLDPKYVPLLVRDITAQTDTLVDSLDDALNNPAASVKPGNEVQDAVRLGVSVYVFEAPVEVEPASRAKGQARRTGRAER
ncbi:MAG TPA: DUF6502 family protein [Gemmatimonadaceae bacterium]|nr:DUF6502 family protein [Gemmatimonadaceae bacterium]